MPRITVSNINLRDIEYHEYLCTGFAILRVLDEIQQFNLSYSDDTFHADQDGLDWTCHMWEVDLDGKKIKFATHVTDHAVVYSQRALEECDLYFKCQCPMDPIDGLFRLNSKVNLPLPDYAKEHVSKIRPFLIARPLSRRLDINANVSLLNKFAEFRENTTRNINLLAYLGVSIDMMYPDTPDIDDVHFKRVRMLLHLWNNRDKLPGIRFLFRVPSHCQHLTHHLPKGWEDLPKAGTITDRRYLDLCRQSKATLNTMGIGGSTPFRVVDALMTGMVCMTDRMVTRWPWPLRHMSEILEIGNMGFEPMDGEDWKAAMERIEAYLGNIDALRARIVPSQNAFYNTWLTPQALARYILDECIKLA